MKILLLLAAAFLATAQQKLPDLATFVFVDVIPSMTGEHETSIAAMRDAFKKSGSPPFFSFYAPLFASQYVGIGPLADLSSSDNGVGENIRKSMGDAAYQKWLPQYRRTISHFERLVVRPMPDLSIRDAPRGSLPILVMGRVRVAFGRHSEFEAQMRDVVIPAMRKAGVKRYVVGRVVFGGASNEYIIARSHNGLVEAEKSNQVIASLPIPAGLFLSNVRTVYRLNQNLSYSEASPSN